MASSWRMSGSLGFSRAAWSNASIGGRYVALDLRQACDRDVDYASPGQGAGEGGRVFPPRLGYAIVLLVHLCPDEMGERLRRRRL